jgi:hypothetical protein
MPSLQAHLQTQLCAIFTLSRSLVPVCIQYTNFTRGVNNSPAMCWHSPPVRAYLMMTRDPCPAKATLLSQRRLIMVIVLCIQMSCLCYIVTFHFCLYWLSVCFLCWLRSNLDHRVYLNNPVQGLPALWLWPNLDYGYTSILKKPFAVCIFF